MKLDQYQITECSCKKCISYCKERPGWFRPKEISSLAEYLGMSVEETFQKYLILNWFGEDKIYVLSPVKDFDKLLFSKDPLKRELASLYLESNKLLGRDCDRAGSYASFAYAFVHAPCIFLRNNSECGIYPVRPFECKVTWHENDDSIKSVRKLIAAEWKKSKLLEQLDLFGEFHRPARRLKL